MHASKILKNFGKFWKLNRHLIYDLLVDPHSACVDLGRGGELVIWQGGNLGLV